MEAVDKYDCNKGSFSTYAIYWIRQSISRGLENLHRTIRLPSYLLEKQGKVLKARAKLESILERTPTDKELAIKCNVPAKEIRELLNITRDPISFNKPVKATEEDTTLKDNIKDDKPTPEELTESKLFIQEFKATAKDRLTNVEFKALTMFLGIGVEEHTLQEIADKLGYKRSYIADKKNNALRKIKETKLIKEIEEETIYYKSIDYSSPSSKTNKLSSPVENIVIQKEKKLNKRMR